MLVSVQNLKEHLSFTADLGTADDALMARLLAAAENHVDKMLGFRLETAIDLALPDTEFDGLPPALGQAITQLAAHWYENREAAGPDLRQVPFGVEDLVSGFREWTF